MPFESFTFMKCNLLVLYICGSVYVSEGVGLGFIDKIDKEIIKRYDSRMEELRFLLGGGCWLGRQNNLQCFHQ